MAIPSQDKMATDSFIFQSCSSQFSITVLSQVAISKLFEPFYKGYWTRSQPVNNYENYFRSDVPQILNFLFNILLQVSCFLSRFAFTFAPQRRPDALFTAFYYNYVSAPELLSVNCLNLGSPKVFSVLYFSKSDSVSHSRYLFYGRIPDSRIIPNKYYFPLKHK